jgi:hypothetical protein
MGPGPSPPRGASDTALNHRILVEPEASAELEEAALWYDKQHPGLGLQLLNAVDATVAHIDRWPDTAPRVPELANEIPARRVPVPRFPYSIVYLMANDAIRVLAFAHQRRKPNYWRVRAAGRREGFDG